MLRGVYTSAAGMVVQSERLNVISNNLANVDTKGFKKDQTLIKAFPDVDLYRKNDNKDDIPHDNISKLTRIGTLGRGAVLEDTYTEFTQGRMERTDNKLDFAIRGNEFFVVETMKGIRLTRDGSFYTSNDGFIVTSAGDRVIGRDENGNLGYMKSIPNAVKEISDNGAFSGVTIEGTINEPKITRPAGRLTGFLMVTPDQNSLLMKEGSNYYSYNNIGTLATSEKASVQQGYVEGSNVSIIKEMVEMIECSRAYETNQKVLTSQDEVLNKVVNDVGRWV